MSRLSEFLAKGRSKRPGLMKRGNLARAKRDVLARRLEKKGASKTPYSLASFIVKAGAKVKDGDVERELAERTRMAKRK